MLRRLAPWVGWGLLGTGLALFLDRVGPLVSDVQLTFGERIVVGNVALVVLGGFGLAGWLAGALLRAASDVIDVIVSQAESAARTADAIENQLTPLLVRIADALEAPGGHEEGRAPGVADLRARFEAARHADDPETGLALRDQLARVLPANDLEVLDRRLIRWTMGRIEEAMRREPLTIATVRLAEQVVDRFGASSDGARLNRALPNLRRRAGLCPRCGQISTERGADCPRCGARGRRVRAGD